MPPDSPNPTNSHGRTAIIVLLMMLATAAGFAAISLVVDSDSQVVLQMLAIIIGSVGTVWAILLAVRAAVKGESLLFPFLVLLPIFWALCYPLLATWPTANRGVDDKWYFLHFFLFPLTIPLGMFALTVATPALFWFRRRTARAEESDRPRLRKRTRLIFLGIASAVFVLLAPFGFYLYGGTMNKESPFWTQDAVATMPLWIGNADYRLLRSIPGSHCELLANEMLCRGELSSETLTSEFGGKYSALLTNSVFTSLTQKSPEVALDLSRTQMNSPKAVFPYELAAFFAKNVSPEEVRSYLSPNAFIAITPRIKSSFVDGVEFRRDAVSFTGDMSALIEEKTVNVSANDVSLAAHFLVDRGTDIEIRVMYLKLLERQSVNISAITGHLLANRNSAIVEEGLRFPDEVSRDIVLRGILSIANRKSPERNKFITPLFPQLTRLLDSAHESDRILSALIILAETNELTPLTRDLFTMSAKGNALTISFDRANNAQKRVLVEHAREAANIR